MKYLPAPASWKCPSCGRENLLLEYCPACGEQYLHAHRVSLLGLAEQAVESTLHADGRIARTVKTLLFTPGRLTEAWMTGERRGWIGPFQLFLFLNVVFFFAQSLSGLSVLAAPLHYLTETSQRMVDVHLAEHGGTQADLRPAFDRQQATNAKVLCSRWCPYSLFCCGCYFHSADNSPRYIWSSHCIFTLTCWPA